MVFRRRREAVTAALISHFVVDTIRHDEPFDESHEMRLDLIALDGLLLGLALVLVGKRHGPLSPQFLGALAGALPDAEHLLLRPTQEHAPKVHTQFPHAVWPSKPIGLRRQFLIGAVTWLALLLLPMRFLSAAGAADAGNGSDRGGRRSRRTLRPPSVARRHTPR